MAFSEPIDPHYLLASLNGERDFGSEVRDNSRRFKAREMNDGEWQGLFAAPDEDYRKASEVFVSELRKLVDEWLDSGRSGGIEMPKTRSLEKVLTAYHAMSGWLERNKPSLFATTSGEIMHTFGWRGFPTDGEDKPIHEAKEEARRIFVLLMGSPVKYALFKCSERDCGRYYVLEKPRKMYKRQTCCPQHRSWRSALRGTKEKRERERNAALEIAADALKEWPSLTARTRAKYHNSAKEYITDKVFRLSLSAKWVTRNLSEIEKRAKGELK